MWTALRKISFYLSATHVYSSVGSKSGILTSVYPVHIILSAVNAALSYVLFDLPLSNLTQDITCSDGRGSFLRIYYRDTAEHQSTTTYTDVNSISFLSKY